MQLPMMWIGNKLKYRAASYNKGDRAQSAPSPFEVLCFNEK